MPEVLMPRLSDTMEEGTLSQWVKHEGDQVARGDILAVIETDKAAMDMEAYDEGVLTRVLVEEGSSVPIGTPIAVIGDQAVAAAPAAAPTASTAAPTAPAAAPGEARPTAQPPAVRVPPSSQASPAPGTSPGRASSPDPAAPPAPPSPGQVRTSPLARALARKHGIELATVRGTGPGGRIVRADIEDAIRQLGAAQPVPQPTAAAPTGPAEPAPIGPAAPAPSADATPLAPAMDAEEVPLSTVRRLTAQRLADSAREAPHFYLTVVAGADELLAFRAQVNDRSATDIKISVTDLLIKACAAALAAHPEVNVSWGQTRILRHRRINVGVAVAIDDGLIVPVVRDADRKTLTGLAREAHDLTARARARRLTPEELSGGTFTVSNLGMYGIRQFTAVINPPQAAILAVGATTRQPVVRGGEVTIGTTITLTLSIDHRAVDGATAAAFLTDLQKLIEEPLGIVV
jgi:pyruvate dehydrogenase E2 component (dihydrolipoyllysine-residue acetyltransferase)